MVTQLVDVGGYTTRHTGFSVPDPLRDRLRFFSPKTDLGRIVRSCFAFLPADLAGELLDHISRTVVLESSLGAVILRGGKLNPFSIEDYGIVSRKVITTAGVNFLVDAWQGTVEPEIMKYHGIGTGSTAEAAGDTALVTESTTALNPDSTRATGSLTEGASANIFRTVGTNTVDASVTVAEHGIFSQAATGGGTLWDRSLTGSLALVSGDSLQTTYDCTCSAGG
jgi:hypothetical protein